MFYGPPRFTDPRVDRVSVFPLNSVCIEGPYTYTEPKPLTGYINICIVCKRKGTCAQPEMHTVKRHWILTEIPAMFGTELTLDKDLYCKFRIRCVRFTVRTVDLQQHLLAKTAAQYNPKTFQHKELVPNTSLLNYTMSPRLDTEKDVVLRQLYVLYHAQRKLLHTTRT